MRPDRVSNPGPLTYESGALPTALCGPAKLLLLSSLILVCCTVELQFSNTDGLFTQAVSNLFLSPLEKSHSCRFWIF